MIEKYLVGEKLNSFLAQGAKMITKKANYRYVWDDLCNNREDALKILRDNVRPDKKIWFHFRGKSKKNTRYRCAFFVVCEDCIVEITKPVALLLDCPYEAKKKCLVMMEPYQYDNGAAVLSSLAYHLWISHCVLG